MSRPSEGTPVGRLFLAAGLAILALSTASFRWPVDNATVTSTFGESRWDHFHDGMDVISPDLKIFPVTPGRLVYNWNRARFPLDRYSGMGNFKVVDHGNALFSIYGHLHDDPTLQTSYAEGDVLGIMGNTGHSMARHLHFTLIKLKEGKSINPLTVLPAVKDERPPVHQGTYLRIGEKYIPIRGKINYRLTRHYPLLLEITDTISGRERLGVFRLSVELNDRKVLDAEFGEIGSVKNVLTVGGMASEDLFDEKGYYRVAGARYAEGENRLKITAFDYAGNKMESDLTFMVNLDLK